MTVSKFDAVIIGSGQAGNPLAVKFAVSGKKVALVEREHIGGSCANVGCSPTKTMEASGRVAHIVSRAADYGVTFQGPSTVDMRTVRRRKRDIVTAFTTGDKAKLDRKGVEIVWGEGRFTSGDEGDDVQYDGDSYRRTLLRYEIKHKLLDDNEPVKGGDLPVKVQPRPRRR